MAMKSVLNSGQCKASSPLIVVQEPQPQEFLCYQKKSYLIVELDIILDLENGHTLHLVVRHPAESMPSSGTPSEGANANDAGNGTNGGPSRGRGHISHSVVLGRFNSADQTEGFVSRVRVS
ncbi:Uncharacterized protein Rs2_29612 [Raphanus sativus]|nr:Uncharacterized protein Rs2_29612 [Raphanus sativus]